LTTWSSLDHNGYGVLPIRFGGPVDPDKWGTEGRGEVLLKPEEAFPMYRTLEEFAEATGWEKNAVKVDYGIFKKAYEPTHDNKLYPVESVDLTLVEDSVAVDAGCVLPNINEGYAGAAP